MSDRVVMARNVKDSVFCDLFSQSRYALRLYQALHPDDADVGESDIEVVTRQCVVTTHPYNDLGLAVGNRLLVLVEAQSTWNESIAARAFMYAADTLREWARDHDVSLYRVRAAQLPRPELYVVYTGTRRGVPSEVTLDACFGAPADVSAVVHVLRGGTDDIVGEYVDFSEAVDRWRDAHGRSREATLGAIRECVGRGILVEYLSEKEAEVIDIMMTLYDVEEVQRTFLADAARTAMAEGRAKGMAEGRAKGMAEGRAKGMAEGRAKGRAEGESRLGRLVALLIAAGRTEDAARAATDERVRSRLYEELEIV